MRDELPSLEASPVWHPYTPVPHQGPRANLVKAQGAYVYDAAGKRYYDATSSWWCNLHGHCHPDLVAALTRQASQLDQILFSPHVHPVAMELSQKLLAKAGAPFAKVFYSDDGSTAVEAAMKMARQYWFQKGETQRTHFLSVEYGYHGDTLGAVSVGHIDEFHQAFSPVMPVWKSTAPYCYRCPLGLRYPDCGVACTERALDRIERDGDQIAAFIVEPLVMGAGGFIVYPKEYLERLMKACREKGILVIFDEVFTGFGRTGTFFAMEQLDARPDLLCLSKGLTSGMLALGATLASREIFEAFVGGESKKFFHGHTFTANALACAVALESLAIFDRENVMERNRKTAAFLGEQTARFRALPHVGDIRHRAMIWAMELVRDPSMRAPFVPASAPGWAIATRAWERGVWVRPMGSMLYVIPPYCSGEEDLRHCFDVLYSEMQGDVFD